MSLPVLRVARPTNQLPAIVEMYKRGLDFIVLAEFAKHVGFDGCILGIRGAPYHLEFTSERGEVAGPPPSEDNVLVFYVADRGEWAHRCECMVAAGFRVVASRNPYWDIAGRTFEDLDGYRVVIQNSSWSL